MYDKSGNFHFGQGATARTNIFVFSCSVTLTLFKFLTDLNHSLGIWYFEEQSRSCWQANYSLNFFGILKWFKQLKRNVTSWY